MKNLCRNLGIISAISCIGIGSANAQLTAYESFDYPAFDPLVGQVATAPFGTWAGNDAPVNPDGLVYVGLETSALSMTTNGGGRTTNTVSSTVNTGVQYFSFIANYNFNTAISGTNGYSTIEFTSGGTSAFGLGISNNGGAGNQFMAENQTGVYALGSSQFSPSGVSFQNNAATHLFVGKIEYSANAGEDVLTWWLDPTSLGGAEPAVTNATLIGEFAFDTLRIAKFYNGANPRYDEIRLGDTYASVTPAAAVLPPAEPSDLVATPDSFSEITLTWTDNSDDETGFKIERSPDGSTNWVQIASPGADVTDYQDSSLTASTQYFYRVNAYNPGGNSTYTTVASATTLTLPVFVPLDTIYIPFADLDSTPAASAGLVTGVTGYSGVGTINTSSALSYPGVASSGNGLTTAGGRFFMTLDTTLPGLAQYVSGGRIGGSGLGTLYVSWLARGINPQEANIVEFRTDTINDNDGVLAVGTTFGNDFIRAITSNGLNQGANNFATSTVPASPDTVFYVAKLTFGPNNTSTVNVYINQLSEGTPDVSNAGFLQFNTIGFAKFGPAAVPSIDEFRIGTSFAAVTGNNSASGLVTFRTDNGLASNGSQDLLTPANDGVSNLVKFAFNMIGAGAGQAATLGVPNVSILAPAGSAGLPLQGSDAGKLTITYIRRKASSNPGITYAVVFSDSLTSFAVNPSATETTQSIDGTFERVTVTDSAVSSKRFARVEVLAP